MFLSIGQLELSYIPLQFPPFSDLPEHEVVGLCVSVRECDEPLVAALHQLLHHRQDVLVHLAHVAGVLLEACRNGIHGEG